MGIYSQFCEKRSVLFSTDVASRGLDFNKTVDWVVQMDCPEDVASYIHRVGRTARYTSGGRSVLFLMPSEMKMLEKLQGAKIPIQFIKANTKRLQPVSGLLSALLVKYPDMQALAQRAFITYLRSIHIHKDKEIFDVMKLPVDEFSASLGLPMTPRIRFLNQKTQSKIKSDTVAVVEPQNVRMTHVPREELLVDDLDEEQVDKDILLKKDAQTEVEKAREVDDMTMPATRILKKKKLKINVHRPLGTRVVFDEEGNSMPPLARVADTNHSNILFDQDKKDEYYRKMREELKLVDKEDKLLDRQRRRDKRVKEKIKWKKSNMEEEDDGEESGSEGEMEGGRKHKRSKIYFDSDSDSDYGEREENKDTKGINGDSITIAEQEEVALKLLSSMHS